MSTFFEGAGSFGTEFLESGFKSASSLGSSAQGIAQEVADYTRSAFETGSATFEKLFAANSLEAAIEIQAAYAKTAYEGLVAETGKLSGLYADMAKDAYKPFEGLVAKAR
ncbi:MAG: phasin family protein [Rhizobiaceae bacterium]|nr:phasin family protein [Rhizobiaceae bacterium]